MRWQITLSTLEGPLTLGERPYPVLRIGEAFSKWQSVLTWVESRECNLNSSMWVVCTVNRWQGACVVAGLKCTGWRVTGAGLLGQLGLLS